MSHAQESSPNGPPRIEAATVGVPSYSVTLPRVPEAAGQARGFVRLALAAWGLSSLAGDAALVASELATNAVLHARGGEVRVTVERLGSSRVRVAVADESGAPARERTVRGIRARAPPRSRPGLLGGHKPRAVRQAGVGRAGCRERARP